MFRIERFCEDKWESKCDYQQPFSADVKSYEEKNKSKTKGIWEMEEFYRVCTSEEIGTMAVM